MSEATPDDVIAAMQERIATGGFRKHECRVVQICYESGVGNWYVELRTVGQLDEDAWLRSGWEEPDLPNLLAKVREQ